MACAWHNPRTCQFLLCLIYQIGTGLTAKFAVCFGWRKAAKGAEKTGTGQKDQAGLLIYY
jgi:hypothetical protein